MLFVTALYRDPPHSEETNSATPAAPATDPQVQQFFLCLSSCVTISCSDWRDTKPGCVGWKTPVVKIQQNKEKEEGMRQNR